MNKDSLHLQETDKQLTSSLVTRWTNKCCSKQPSKFTMRSKSSLNSWTKVWKGSWWETFQQYCSSKYKNQLGSMSSSAKKCLLKLQSCSKRIRHSNTSSRCTSLLTTWTKARQMCIDAICRAIIMSTTTLKTSWWPSITKTGKTASKSNKTTTTTRKSTRLVGKSCP